MIELLQNLINPEWLSQYGGLYFVALIVFAETGLFVGFFLPGDTLLFIAGMMIASTATPFEAPASNLVYWVLLISLAGIIGNYVGYWFGRKSGDVLFDRKDTWLFKKRHLLQAQAFYETKGGGAIVLARFLPIVRTFAPIIAGVVKMDFRNFTFFNIVGSLAWVGSIVTAGYLLGDNVWVKGNLEKIVLGIALLSTTPVVLKMIRGKSEEPAAVPVPVVKEIDDREGNIL
ncbi:MAG: DedA family protein [Sphingobacteriales bacterium]|nr:MAG: DedA family protein [Sphingobacteriales bacterium]